MCILLFGHMYEFRRATFYVLNSHMWLVITELDKSSLEAEKLRLPRRGGGVGGRGREGGVSSRSRGAGLLAPSSVRPAALQPEPP